jgi:DNA-binding CsgD family transcriptional regulator
LRSGTAQSPEGRVGADYEACPRQEFEASAAFREFYAPRDCIHGLGGVILASGNSQSVITAQRGVEAGPFGDAEKSILGQLMPHLKRAALLHGELGSLRRQVATLTGHLERYPYAFLLMDASRHILYSNVAAREILVAQDGLTMKDGRLGAVSADVEEALGKAVNEIGPERSRTLGRLEIRRPSRRKSYRLLLMPIDEVRPIVPLGVAVPAVSVIVIDPESASSPDPEVLRELFSLTPAEARVAVRLVQGQSAAEIADETGTSTETIRTHLKRILSKTGTKRQGELISLILRSTLFRV